MRMFSYTCAHCGHSLLSTYAENPVVEWMKFGMVLTPEGGDHFGEYNGYGDGLGIDIEAAQLLGPWSSMKLVGKSLANLNGSTTEKTGSIQNGLRTKDGSLMSRIMR